MYISVVSECTSAALSFIGFALPLSVPYCCFSVCISYLLSLEAPAYCSQGSPPLSWLAVILAVVSMGVVVLTFLRAVL